MLGLGPPELAIILILVLIVFGAGKLPQVFSSLGRGVREFRDASEGTDRTTTTTTTVQNPPVGTAANPGNPVNYANNPYPLQGQQGQNVPPVGAQIYTETSATPTSSTPTAGVPGTTQTVTTEHTETRG